MPGPLTPISRIRPPLWILISKNGSFGEVPALNHHPESVSSCPNLGLASRLKKLDPDPVPSVLLQLSSSPQESLPGSAPQTHPTSHPAASLHTEDTLALPPACRGRNPHHLIIFYSTPTAANTANNLPKLNTSHLPPSFLQCAQMLLG